MATPERTAVKKFEPELEQARRLLAEDGFYQLRDKRRTTEEVHNLARVVEELIIHLDQAERSAIIQRTRADELEEKVQVAQSRGFSGPDSYYGNTQERLAELEQQSALLQRQREDERERLQTVVDQRQAEWERADRFGNALQAIVAPDVDIEQARSLANEALAAYPAS